MSKRRRGAMLLWGDFRLWIGAPRTSWMILPILLLCVLQVVQGWKGPLRDETLFPLEVIIDHFYGGFNLMMSSSIFLLGCSEIPKRIPWQQQMLIRASRRSWLLAYIGQCLLMVLVTIAMMIAITLLLSIGHMRPGNGWSDLERIAREEILPAESIMPPFLVENMTPLQGALMCLAPLTLFWFSMLLVILLFGMTSKPHAGLMICAFAVLSHVCLLVDDGWMAVFALFRYARLSGMDLARYGMTYFWKAMIGYAALDLGLIAIMTVMVKRMDLTLTSSVRY